MKTPVLMRLFLIAMILVSASSYAADRIKVAVSIVPQKRLVQRIAGDLVEVQLMVQPGQSPATYEPTPKQIEELSQVHFYYRIGVPFEHVWLQHIQDAYPDMPILDARDGIELRIMDDGDADHHDHEHAHGERDPHIWLSPPLIKAMAIRLRDQLLELDPQHRDIYMQNHADLNRSLDLLDADIRKSLVDMDSKSFMVYHPSWGYFADTYGLRQIPIESEGKEPGTKTLARLLQQARENKVGAIFVQKQFSQHQAKAIASAIGARVVVIDPLSEDYPDNLRDVAEAMAQGL